MRGQWWYRSASFELTLIYEYNLFHFSKEKKTKKHAHIKNKHETMIYFICKVNEFSLVGYKKAYFVVSIHIVNSPLSPTL